jgi:hypothetical protein
MNKLYFSFCTLFAENGLKMPIADGERDTAARVADEHVQSSGQFSNIFLTNPKFSMFLRK